MARGSELCVSIHRNCEKRRLIFQEASSLDSSFHTITSPVKDIDRQMKLEADAVHDGLLRYAQSYEYQLATDSKPVRDLLGHCLKPLANAIRAEQLELKTSQR